MPRPLILSPSLSASMRLAVCCMLAVGFLTAKTWAVHNDSVELFRSDFSADEDANNDSWPDEWTRVMDRQHPKYISIATQYRSDFDPLEVQAARRSMSQMMLAWQYKKRPGDVIPEAVPKKLDRLFEETVFDRCLQIDMNGSAAAIQSSEFLIEPQFTYEIIADLQCENLNNYDLILNLISSPSKEQTSVLQSSESMSGTMEWQTVTLFEQMSGETGPMQARLRIDVTPRNFSALNGIARIDNVRVIRSPRLTVSVTPSDRVISPNELVFLDCQITGLASDQVDVSIDLYDVDRNLIQDKTVQTTKKIHTESQRTLNNSENAGINVCQASLEIASPGYYTIEVSLKGTKSKAFSKEISLAVIEKVDLPSRPNPRFAIELPQAGSGLSWSDTTKLITRLNLGCIKLPVWWDTSNSSHLANLSRTLEILSAQDIRTVAVLDHPPASQIDKFPGKSGETAASALEYFDVWQPLMQSVWQNVCLHTQRFQIGWDDQIEFAKSPKLPQILSNLQSQMTLFGPACNILISNDIFAATDSASPNTQTTLYTRPNLTGEEIKNYGSFTNDSSGKSKWISIGLENRPGPVSSQDVVALCRKMVAVQTSNFEAGTFSRKSVGSIIKADGGPGPMMLPIHNLANWLHEADAFEWIEVLPASQGLLFQSNGQSNLLLMPSNSDKRQHAWLGKDITAIDIWGRDVELTHDITKPFNPIIIDPLKWPLLVKNVNRKLIQWRNAIELTVTELEINFLGVAAIPFQVANPDLAAVSGEVRLICSDLFLDSEVVTPFALLCEQSNVFSTPATLKPNIAEGDFDLVIEVELQSPDNFGFVLNRTVHVGLPGIKLQSKCDLLANDVLRINLLAVNSTGDKVSLDMLLFLPDQPRQRLQMIDVRETGNQTFFIQNASRYSGRTLRLSCEQIGQKRGINHLIAVPEVWK